MIRITVELVSAITGNTTKLGEMEITNDGTGTDSVCNYLGKVLMKPSFKQVTRKAVVTGHRRHDKTIWHLVGKMLGNMGYTR